MKKSLARKTVCMPPLIIHRHGEIERFVTLLTIDDAQARKQRRKAEDQRAKPILKGRKHSEEYSPELFELARLHTPTESPAFTHSKHFIVDCSAIQQSIEIDMNKETTVSQRTRRSSNSPTSW